jgi:hypothetical protein
MVVATSWVLLSMGVAVMAHRRGRSIVLWFLLSIIMSPVITGLLAWGLGDVTEKEDEKLLSAGGYTRCPYCHHAVKKEAAVCRHCARVLVEGHSVVR